MNVLFVLVTALLSAAKQMENFVLLIEIQFLFNKQIHVAFDWAEMTEGEIFDISSFCMHQAQQGLCRKKNKYHPSGLICLNQQIHLILLWLG